VTPGVAVRPAQTSDAAAIAQVRIDAWRAAYRGIIPDAYLDAMSLSDSAAFWERILASGSPRASVFVAVEGDVVVGFAAANRRDPPKLGFDAELSAIYLAAGYKRRGIGRRLVAAVAAAQRERGATGMLTWVIAKNKEARSFYEALGGELLVEQQFQWDGLDLVEAGYGFRDLDALAATDGANPALH
jgi:GNAT superfamily N-acetyltransferase